DFWVVNEPKLASIVSTPPPGDQRSLNQAMRGEIDTSRVKFERGFSLIDKASGSLKLDRGVLRGPAIGLIFQGTLYDKRNRMDMTGTFMPAYGLNRIFAEIPLFGQILGNGSDRGLIGVTFRLSGDANSPNLQVNPLSVIAPGIFRSIFEFRG
ncbi:MAG: AsmA-like C-terminal region-containing protein, partial [Bauldia sp.]